LSATDLQSWERQGFFIRRGFADAAVGDRMLARVVDICRAADRGEDVGPALILPEARVRDRASTAGARWSEFLRLQRDTVFEAFARYPAVLDLGAGVLGPELDCFLSQFIFKMPGAYGQPWHQDSYYFPFDPGTQVGVWLAVSRATLENGCLWVLPGSHTEPV